jgi:hypothetical protein
MRTVLGPVEDAAPRIVYDPGGHPFSARGGEAVE